MSKVYFECYLHVINVKYKQEKVWGQVQSLKALQMLHHIEMTIHHLKLPVVINMIKRMSTS